jgi:hypothetical protein
VCLRLLGLRGAAGSRLLPGGRALKVSPLERHQPGGQRLRGPPIGHPTHSADVPESTTGSKTIHDRHEQHLPQGTRAWRRAVPPGVWDSITPGYRAHAVLPSTETAQPVGECDPLLVSQLYRMSQGKSTPLES